MSGGTEQVVAKHDSPVRHCFFVPQLGSTGGMLVSGGWDKTLRYWDLRQAQPAFKQDLPERVYGMDIKYPLLVPPPVLAPSSPHSLFPLIVRAMHSFWASAH